MYQPIAMGAENVFAYRPAVLQPKDVLPLPDSAAGANTIQGALLLFKIPVANSPEPPAELQIPPPNGAARAGLDVSTQRRTCCARPER